MNTKHVNETSEGRPQAGGKNGFTSTCNAVLARILDAKNAFFAEARNTLNVRERLVQLALNDAEALAWETSYPHLFFPDLAAEKIRGLSAWDNHQRALERQSRG